MARRQLSEPEVGILLLCFAFGAIVAMNVTGRLLPRLGAETVCPLATLAFGLLLPVVAYIPDPLLFGACVALLGGTFGSMDVAMNTEASALERERGRSIMSSFHALYSVGNLVGAGLSGQMLHLGERVETILIANAAIVVAAAGLCWHSFSMPLTRPVASLGTEKATSRRPSSRRVYLLGAIAFLSFFAEGAIIDWIAILLVDVNGLDKSSAAFGFAIFAGTMACGRLVGDALTNHVGASTLLRTGSLLVCAGFGVVLLVESTPVIFAALAVSGFAVANVIPAIFSAAGRAGGRAASVAMSRVATMAYSGLLFGPAFIGFLAHATTLTTSLSAVIVAMAVVASLAATVEGRR